MEESYSSATGSKQHSSELFTEENMRDSRRGILVRKKEFARLFHMHEACGYLGTKEVIVRLLSSWIVSILVSRPICPGVHLAVPLHTAMARKGEL